MSSSKTHTIHQTQDGFVLVRGEKCEFLYGGKSAEEVKRHCERQKIEAEVSTVHAAKKAVFVFPGFLVEFQ